MDLDAPVPDPGPAGPRGTMAWLRATVSRFANGETHARRRALVEALLAELDPATLRDEAAALARASVASPPPATAPRPTHAASPSAGTASRPADAASPSAGTASRPADAASPSAGTASRPADAASPSAGIETPYLPV